MFNKYNLELPDDIYTKLKDSIIFENITKGRLGAVLLYDKCIVRTTTKYTLPPQLFTDLHEHILSEIYKISNTNYNFNNALTEIYNNSYKNMKFHTDQTLDLEKNTSICILSLYENKEKPNRKLVIKNKETGIMQEFILEHNTCIIFTLQTNALHTHKIVRFNNEPNTWLGMTFRVAKKHDFELRLANNDEEKEFFRIRSLENKKIEFEYPKIDYTISKSDLLVPITLKPTTLTNYIGSK